jgi:S1-C subfamily serine protease
MWTPPHGDRQPSTGNGEPPRDTDTGAQSHGDDPWRAEPTYSTAGEAKDRQGVFRWLAVVTISARVGAAVGAVVANGDDSVERTESSLSSNSSKSEQISAPATPSSIRSVLQKVEPSVVTIETAAGGTGTGMIISNDGLILTNAHVVENASLRVTLHGERNSRSAGLLGIDRSIDAAVIKVETSESLPILEFGDSGQLQVGDEVVAIGNALALAGGPSVTTGIVSAVDRTINDGSTVLSNLIQTDAAINPGNSGGPLLNMAGQVVGMNTAVIRGQDNEYQNIGFAMAINAVKPAVPDLQSGKVRQQALLGVSAVTLTDELRERNGFRPEKGAIIDTVAPDGPADSAGLSRFDVITAVNDREITSSEELTATIRSFRPDEKVKITFYRNDDRQEVEVTLGTRPITG